MSVYVFVDCCCFVDCESKEEVIRIRFGVG